MASGNWFVRSLRSRAGLIQWVLLLGAVGFVAWIVVSRGHDLEAAFKLTPALFLFITLSSFATFILNGIELQVLARHFGSKVPMSGALMLGLAVNTLNYLPMKAGTVLNGIVMRTRYKLPLSAFTALIAASSVIHLWVALVMAGTCLVLGPAAHRAWGWLFLLGPTAGVAGLIIWGRMRTAGRFESHDSRVIRILMRIVDGMGQIFSDGRLLAIELVINFSLVTLWTLRSYWSFQALGMSPSYGQVVTVTALGILFTRISVIPGGVGLREVGASFGSAISGLSVDAGFAASVIERAVMLIWLLVVGVPSTLYLLRSTGVGLADIMSGARGVGATEEAGASDGAAGPDGSDGEATPGEAG